MAAWLGAMLPAAFESAWLLHLTSDKAPIAARDICVNAILTPAAAVSFSVRAVTHPGRSPVGATGNSSLIVTSS